MKYPKLSGVITIAVSLVLFFSVYNVLSLRADTESHLGGWAWSSTIGWISMDCNNEVAKCAASNYQVLVDSDGFLNGYGWSSNIGWVKFGGLNGFPAGSGTVSGNAKIQNNVLTGWARAVSAGGINAGGWDGWISLGGTNHSIPLNNENFSGFGWGSDVVGWITWGGGNGGTVTVIPPTVATFDYTVTAPNVSVRQGGSTQTTISLSTVSTPSELVTLSFSGVPSGVTITPVGGNACTPTCSKIFMVSADSGVALGSPTITVTGVSAGGIRKSTTFTLSIVNGDFSVTCAPSTRTAIVDSNVTWTAVLHGADSTATYSYSWSGDAPLVDSTQRTVVVKYNSLGTKTASVHVVGGGYDVSCSSNVTVTRRAQYDEY